jgi:aspartate carbamoyltransferase regulatory subunit
MEQHREKKLSIRPIEQGTAIDHLPVGTALKIISVLHVKNEPMTAAVNVPSKKMGRKDLLFIENRFLDQNEISKVALIAKGATLNVIKGAKVIKKEKLRYPAGMIEDAITCINPNCISIVEKLKSKFRIISEHPLKAKCYYCETTMDEAEIARSIE